MTTSNHMSKAIRLLFLGCLLAFCANAQATIALNVTSPAAGALAGNSLHIVAGVTSTYQIQSVTATVAGGLTNLTFDATAGWIGDSLWQDFLAVRKPFLLTPPTYSAAPVKPRFLSFMTNPLY